MPGRNVSITLLAPLSCALIAGCGTTVEPFIVPSRPDISHVAGNWLLAGPLPGFPFDRSGGTELSVTVSVPGDQIVGLGSFLVTCPSSGGGISGNVGGGGGFLATGTIAEDGSFRLTSPATAAGGLTIPSVSIAGTVPNSPGEGWSGSYVIHTFPSTSCAVQRSASLTAEAIQPFSGTYAAKGTYTDGATESPVVATMVLQQGATSESPNGQPVSFTYVLSGTLEVKGVPCFHTGVSVAPATPEPHGVGDTVEGGVAFPAFRMDDGSLAIVNVDAHDLTNVQLDTFGAGISGGPCASIPGRQLTMGNFTRLS